ncbi:MAG: MFS transporter [Hydrogenophaga sp.]|uniref:MFS transporter n=1 Tax=Hydrogenophaga sp. TaxID=1904254 RepID=UPI0016A30C42|nr:MFS transporter [Hydrogenophaga sp.]NIM40949.1 MFS transporter [Hydrogenophaga sp.]NIN24791.1 MFS transporter [Hydrogenophaga sp.]NIN29303.1 MFS transporter [Hydrogenophaga sp.]NIN53826.1 MFS transporter [Hydrogenophaga sp.]NIO53206.1 MFS transporter [Hydrogenophaga sp.]
MTPDERRSSAALAAIYALRMLGLFIVLPVFALEARHYPGGDDPALIGLALGAYGLTQAFLQMPLGMASDRFGRKPVILLGLAVFAAGSALAAWAPSVQWLLAGRALQGAGAVSAAVTALLADLTRDAVRTKAMALVGISIALMFAVSLVVAPALVPHVGLPGLFLITLGLSLAAMAVVAWGVPAEPARQAHAPRASLREVLQQRDLLRVNVGVFALHAAQIMTWLSVPTLLARAGLAPAQHWQAYLPALVLSLLIVGGGLFRLERRGHFRAVYLGTIALLALVQLGFLTQLGSTSLPVLVALLCLYFVGFNTQEASQPSLASRLAAPHQRGTALGVFNTLMSLGIFVGGALGGLVARHWGAPGIFGASATLLAIWLVAAWGMRPATVAR